MHEEISFLLGPFMYLIAMTTLPMGFLYHFSFSLLAPGIPNLINDDLYHVRSLDPSITEGKLRGTS